MTRLCLISGSLYKLRDVIEILAETFKTNSNPGHQISIDESMIGTKCRVPFLLYMPKKLTKWGIKVWVCAEATTAYVSTFTVYTGKDNDDEYQGKGLAYHVVMRLLQVYSGKHYKIYFNNIQVPNLYSHYWKRKLTRL